MDEKDSWYPVVMPIIDIEYCRFQTSLPTENWFKIYFWHRAIVLKKMMPFVKTCKGHFYHIKFIDPIRLGVNQTKKVLFWDTTSPKQATEPYLLSKVRLLSVWRCGFDEFWSIAQRSDCSLFLFSFLFPLLNAFSLQWLVFFSSSSDPFTFTKWSMKYR